MANYNLTHTWQQVDDATEQIENKELVGNFHLTGKTSMDSAEVSGFAVPQIQKGYVTVSVPANSQSTVTVNFPKRFSAVPTVVCSAVTTRPQLIQCASYSTTVDSVIIYASNLTNNQITVTIRWVAVN